MQVTRQRRRRDPNALAALYGRLGRRARLVIAGAAALAIAGTGSGIALASTIGLGTEQADHTYGGGLVLPDDQVIKPIGDRLVINSGKIMTSAVSPDGTHLAALTADGADSLTIVDLKNWTVQQLVGTSSADNLRISDSSAGQQGPAYSPDGSALWVIFGSSYIPGTFALMGSPAPDVARIKYWVLGSGTHMPSARALRSMNREIGRPVASARRPIIPPPNRVFIRKSRR